MYAKLRNAHTPVEIHNLTWTETSRELASDISEAEYDAIQNRAREAIESRRYSVCVGGAPPDSAVELDSAAEAEEVAMASAITLTEREDEDSGSVEIWGGEGCPEGWGACPANDSGAFYPYITVIEAD